MAQWLSYKIKVLCWTWAPTGETQPVKLLAGFVVDTNETELTISFGKLRPQRYDENLP